MKSSGVGTPLLLETSCQPSSLMAVPRCGCQEHLTSALHALGGALAANLWFRLPCLSLSSSGGVGKIPQVKTLVFMEGAVQWPHWVTVLGDIDTVFMTTPGDHLHPGLGLGPLHSIGFWASFVQLLHLSQNLSIFLPVVILKWVLIGFIIHHLFCKPPIF